MTISPSRKTKQRNGWSVSLPCGGKEDHTLIDHIVISPVYFDTFQVLDMQLPLNKQLMLKIPPVFGLAHVQVDPSARIIYHHVIFRGMLLSVASSRHRRELSTFLYRSALDLVERWETKNRGCPIDFQAAFLMLSRLPSVSEQELYWDLNFFSVLEYANKRLKSWMAADLFDYDFS
jgi:hypothetical protein